MTNPTRSEAEQRVIDQAKIHAGICMYGKGCSMCEAVAALIALDAPNHPADSEWVMVPRIPTQDMLLAAHDAIERSCTVGGGPILAGPIAKTAYEAALASAPNPPLVTDAMVERARPIWNEWADGDELDLDAVTRRALEAALAPEPPKTEKGMKMEWPTNADVETAAAALHDCKYQFHSTRHGNTFKWAEANPEWRANALKEMRIALTALATPPPRTEPEDGPSVADCLIEIDACHEHGQISDVQYEMFRSTILHLVKDYGDAVVTPTPRPTGEREEMLEIVNEAITWAMNNAVPSWVIKLSRVRNYLSAPRHEATQNVEGKE